MFIKISYMWLTDDIHILLGQVQERVNNLQQKIDNQGEDIQKDIKDLEDKIKELKVQLVKHKSSDIKQHQDLTKTIFILYGFIIFILLILMSISQEKTLGESFFSLLDIF